MMQETIQLVILELKRQKKAESFPDHICAQANLVISRASNICYDCDELKYGRSPIAKHIRRKEFWENRIKNSLISTIATCLRMLEDLEK